MNTPSPEYAVHLGDCIPHMATMQPASVDLAVFSPPFPALYAYTSEQEDIGNSEDLKGDAKLHLSFFYHQLARVLKPGRVAVVHVMQLPRMKRAGGVGLFDFRGLNIRLGERAGLVYEYDWAVRKKPQAQAIRTKSRELQFAGLESDRAKSRGALADYLIKFRAPGENEVAVVGNDQVSRENWIEWAECCWMDIKETDTLNVREGRGEEDTKHICPLQLGVIERIVRLYSNVGELVFSPFAGIGSEGFVAVRLGRRFYGCELKPEYHAAALANLKRAVHVRAETNPLFETEDTQDAEARATEDGAERDQAQGDPDGAGGRADDAEQDGRREADGAERGAGAATEEIGAQEDGAGAAGVPGDQGAAGPAAAGGVRPGPSPAMRQYERFKARHPDCILLFRLGDFYEAYDADAETMHKALGLTLTRRGDVPMAGVPHHQLETYLRRLIRAGFRVAVCEQVGGAAEGTGIVERAVTRLIDPAAKREPGAAGPPAEPEPPKPKGTRKRKPREAPPPEPDPIPESQRGVPFVEVVPAVSPEGQPIRNCVSALYGEHECVSNNPLLACMYVVIAAQGRLVPFGVIQSQEAA